MKAKIPQKKITKVKSGYLSRKVKKTNRTLFSPIQNYGEQSLSQIEKLPAEQGASDRCESDSNGRNCTYQTLPNILF